VLLSILLCLGQALPGERLSYDVSYGPLRLGTLVLATEEPETVDHVPCRHFRADLEFSRSLSWLFRAQYRLETWCRDSDFVTIRSYKRTREPNYRAEWTARFEPQYHRVTYSDGRSYALADSARDLLTLWYYLRERELVPGETLGAALHDGRKDTRLVTVVSGPREVETEAGTFDCITVSPRTRGPLGTVFISDDTERLPVVIRARFGGVVVTARLREVE
jgi:hypothetical protein